MLSTFTGRLSIGIAVLVIIFLQYKLWFGEGGYMDRHEMIELTKQQNAKNLKLAERNRVLAAEVNDLKSGMEAVEEHARLDLGLVRPHETFVQLTALPPPIATSTPAKS